jgi:hypothetical protein
VTDDDGATDRAVAHPDVEAPPPASTSTTITSDEPDPSVQGAPVTVRFTVTSSSGTPSGQVTVVDGPDSCTGNLDASGSGSCALNMSVVGSRTIDAHYAGNASFEPSSDGESHTVNPPGPASTSTTITSDEPDPSVQGTPVTVRFTVTSPSGTPSGQVTVVDGPDSCTGNLDASGSGSCALNMSVMGSRTIDAHYAGNASFQASSDAEPHTVNEPPPPPLAETETEITSDQPEPSNMGEPVIVQFRVESKDDDRVPTGTVIVTANAGSEFCTGTLNEIGVGSCAITLLGPNDRELTATYQGNDLFSSSSDNESHNVDEDSDD